MLVIWTANQLVDLPRENKVGRLLAYYFFYFFWGPYATGIYYYIRTRSQADHL